ncbi:MAG: hypothetical protein ABEK00_00425 [Candidatus Nanohaloarchaea archaeon]
MSITDSKPSEDFSIGNFEEEDFEFEQVQSILHGGYKKSRGLIGEDYEVEISERDNGYMIRIREDNKVVDRAFVDSDNPYDDLPETDEDLYRVVSEGLE